MSEDGWEATVRREKRRASDGGWSLPGNGGFGAARRLRASQKANGGTARHRNFAKPLAGAASGGLREGFCKRLKRFILKGAKPISFSVSKASG